MVLPVISSEHSGPKTNAYVAQPPSVLGLRLLRMTLNRLTRSKHRLSHYNIIRCWSSCINHIHPHRKLINARKMPEVSDLLSFPADEGAESAGVC